MFSLKIQRHSSRVLRCAQKFSVYYVNKSQRKYEQIAKSFGYHLIPPAFTSNDKLLWKNIQRQYAQQMESQQITCWNCKKLTSLKNHMLCGECGHLQDVKENTNYFELLQCPQSFELEQTTLTRRFRQLQAIVHPDKYSNKSEREQRNSADWSSLINKAYKTLATPIERGQYILRLKGFTIPQDNSALDKEFLMEMMERNEEVEEATTEADLRQLDERIVKELNEKVNELTVHFKADDIKAAISSMVEMKYLLSLQKSIKTKIQQSFVIA